MVAVTIFWAALFCLIFFLLGTICKVLAATFYGFLEASEKIGAIVFWTLIGMIGLYFIYEIVDGIITTGITGVIGMIIQFVLVIGFVILVAVWLGKKVLGIVIPVIETVFTVLLNALDCVAALFEKVSTHFLLVIIKKLKKC